MIARGASVFLALMLAASCGGSGRAAASPTHTTSTAASPSATPLIDVNDMMGAFPPATFFVSTKDGIKAVALLNHATRYTIPTSGTDVQVAAAGPANRIYVLDQVTEGARLRWFDIDNGSERVSRVIAGARVVSTNIGHGALALDETTGVGYALLHENGGIVTESFDWFTLKSAGSVFGTMTCPSRVMAGGGRVAVACLKEGLVLAQSDGRTTKPGAPFSFIAAAMLGDGTLVAAAEDGRVARLARNATTFEYENTLRDYGAKLIPDGIGVNAGCCFYYGIVDPRANDVQVRAIAGGTMLIAFPETSQPIGGLFVQAPFAYFVIAGRARHVDINQGFGEVMADLGPSAMPGAVSNR
jgi:hypothetical protein